MSNFTATPASALTLVRHHVSGMESLWDMGSLNELAEFIWSTLVQAEGNPGHPWHLPVLTTGSRLGPNARTVVLRGVTRPGYELLAFSDTRTSKVTELRRNSHAVWLFYDAQERVQVRAFTEVRLHSDDTVADTYWHRLPAASRHNYQTEKPPGAVLEEPANGRILAPGSAEHFTVIIGKVTRLDWLWLAREGHRRAEFERQGSGWTGRWLVP